MLPGMPPVLDGELGTAVEAAQAHDTMFLLPGGSAVLHLDGGHGTIPGAQPAAHTAVLYGQAAGLPHFIVGLLIKQLGREHRHLPPDEIPGGTLLDMLDEEVNLSLRGGVDAAHLLRVA